MKKSFIKFISVLLCIVTAAAVISGAEAVSGFAGDINRDGKVNNKDVTVLFRYLNSIPADVDIYACDTNGDGETDNKDVINLFRYLSGSYEADIFYGSGISGEHLKTEIVLNDYNFLSKKEEVVYNISDSSGAFGLYQNAKKSGSTVTLVTGDHSGVYTTFSSPDDRTTTYTFYLKSDTAQTSAAYLTFYLGLRLQNEQMNATSDAVWIAMRNTQIGLRTKAWPNTSYLNAACDFSSGVLLTVSDDPYENVIKIYAGEEKTEIATVNINGNNIVLTTPDSTKKISVRMSSDIIKGGYAHLWAHYPDNEVTVKDLSVTSVREVGLAENDGIKNNSRDLFSDTWTAYDDNGRETVSSDTVPNDKKVGMFYFLWHEESNNSRPLFDHTASYLEGGMESLWKTIKSGSLGFAHYWAEPYFGYYASNDAWVIRKHGALLSEAGVDFVYFDATNGLLYPVNYNAVLKVWAEMRKEGLKTPDVCFMMREGDKNELSNIWTNLYSTNQYEDLWFKWDGKPVILFTGVNNTLTEEQSEFFTIKYSWANENDKWYSNRRGVDCWAWGTMYPQKGGYTMIDGSRKFEQMSVMCGFWVNGSYGTNAGRSYTFRTGEPKTSSNWDMGFALFPEKSGQGLAYQEQFNWALKRAPKILMITGWNEWWAGRWEGSDGASGQLIADEYVVSSDPAQKEYNYYVDNFNPEYSRDIEPMKGGFNDNYYYQTVKNIRDYKGTRPVESAFGQRTIDLKGSLGQWNTVGPEFRDVTGDTTHRNHPSHVGKMTYTNDTGRNDIVTAKISSDNEYLYFYAECADDITKAEGDNWMNLFIKSDGNNENGWYGFDYIINRSRQSGKASVEKFENGWDLKNIGDAEYVLRGNTLVIKLKKSLIKYNGKSLDFKWADNSVNDGDIMGFLDKGDAAPDARFCYRYTTETTGTVIPDCLTEDMAVFKANGYNAFINGKSVHLYENNTKATLLASGYDFYLPVSVLETLGIDCSGDNVYNHYGVEYIKANEAVEKSGKAVTVSPDGLLIISNKKITDTNVLDTLYRSLY